jgi:hypothetical protein
MHRRLIATFLSALFSCTAFQASAEARTCEELSADRIQIIFTIKGKICALTVPPLKPSVPEKVPFVEDGIEYSLNFTGVSKQSAFATLYAGPKLQAATRGLVRLCPKETSRVLWNHALQIDYEVDLNRGVSALCPRQEDARAEYLKYKR